jgi:hypothetical protein
MTVAFAGAKAAAWADTLVSAVMFPSWTRPEISTSLLLSIRSVFLSILDTACSYILKVYLCLEIHPMSGRFIIRRVLLLFGFFFRKRFAGVVVTAEIFPALSMTALADWIDAGETLQAVHRLDDVVIIVRHLSIPLT